ncbi:MAG: hypothetical protein J6X62_00145 [Bacteroidales bacterium]|nr:hypothetical protein [Bacteroidales bacterium]
MPTVTISYDGRNKTARSIMELLRTMDFFHITEAPAKPRRKSGIELAYEDVEAGRVTVWHGGVDEMIEHMLSEE